MTDKEWMACKILYPLVDALDGRAGGRKLWLFACACCRTLFTSFLVLHNDAGPWYQSAILIQLVEWLLATNADVLSFLDQFVSLLQPDGFDEAFDREPCNHHLCPNREQFNRGLRSMTKAVAGAPCFAGENRARRKQSIRCVNPVTIVIPGAAIAGGRHLYSSLTASQECNGL